MLMSWDGPACYTIGWTWDLSAGPPGLISVCTGHATYWQWGFFWTGDRRMKPVPLPETQKSTWRPWRWSIFRAKSAIKSLDLRDRHKGLIAVGLRREPSLWTNTEDRRSDLPIQPNNRSFLFFLSLAVKSNHNGNLRTQWGNTMRTLAEDRNQRTICSKMNSRRPLHNKSNMFLWVWSPAWHIMVIIWALSWTH